MNICLIFPKLIKPYGAERLVLNLSSELAKLGHSVTIYTHRFHLDCSRKLSDEVKIVETGFPNIKNHDVSTLLDLLLMPNLARKVEGSYDIIHAINWQSTFGAVCINKIHGKKYKNVPILYHCTEPPRIVYDLKDITFSNASFWKRFLLGFIIPSIKYIDLYSVKRANKIIAISDWTEKQIKAIYNLNAEIIYPGIEINRFTRYSKVEAKKILGLSPDLKVYLSASKLHRRKRLDIALDIYKKHSENHQSKFFIIGDGDEKSHLERLSQEMKLSNVNFLGRISDDDIPLYFMAADYFIFTAKDEPFGIAPLEAKVSKCKLLGNVSEYPIISWNDSARKIHEVYERMII